MAVSCLHSEAFLHHSPSSSVSSFIGCFQTLRLKSIRSHNSKTKAYNNKVVRGSSTTKSSRRRSLEAVIFDCDGVIVESEDLHRQAYNDAFSYFNVGIEECKSSKVKVVNWSNELYDKLQNKVGGGKPKMRWYFREYGWPSSSILDSSSSIEDELNRSLLIDTLQDWKTERYKEIIKSGSVQPRPGVLTLMDEAKAAGIKVAVCSAATKSSVVLCLESLINIERFKGLDCFLAGDDVKEKKPHPSIYITAADKLGVSVKDCLVIEDSLIGLQAATKAGMSCVITYTSSTSDQDFKDAIAVYPDLSNVRLKDLETLLQNIVTAA
ncbi:unnamed protein product [Cochlearia groenlandica]